MKLGSRGNYRILYRDLDANQVYSHFSIIESQTNLLQQEGLDPKKALKAVREMARTHFAETPPDGTVDGKKAWLGSRWTILYVQWGDYLCEREVWQEGEQTNVPTFTQTAEPDPQPQRPALSEVAAAPPEKQSPWRPSVAHARRYLRRASLFAALFCAGFLANLIVTQPSTPVAGHAERPNKDHLKRALSDIQGKGAKIFSNLDQTLMVFATGAHPFVVVDDKEIQVGDPIVLEDTSGVVSEIHPGRLVLDTDKGSLQFPFPPLVMMMQETMGEGKIALYPDGDNLSRVLRSYCNVNQLKLVGSPSLGCISGRFASENAFKEGCRSLGVDFQQERVVCIGTTTPRAFISFDGFFYQPGGTLSALVDQYAQHLPLDVKQVGVPSDQNWVINYGLQFEEFCSFFDLNIEIRGSYLIVTGGSHENEKTAIGDLVRSNL